MHDYHKLIFRFSAGWTDEHPKLRLSAVYQLSARTLIETNDGRRHIYQTVGNLKGKLLLRSLAEAPRVPTR